MKIAFIPIDNRPVCYQLPKMIVDTNSDIEFFMPGRSLLGDLKKYADIKGLFEWMNSLPKVDAIVLSLDTVAYGGLIPSRRSPDTFEQIKNRIENLKKILTQSNAAIFAFSSIMRISNNNINEEEKEYWNLYGKKIFEYSYNFHKFGTAAVNIPTYILNDYLNTRRRNFEINKIYIEWLNEGVLDTLIFSKDDCAEYGLNVMEAEELKHLGGLIKTGADEIPLTLLARVLPREVKVCPIFLEPKYLDLISNYEDISIEKSVTEQLELAGCTVVNEKYADVLLYVNNFIDNQGEIVMNRDTKPFCGIWRQPEKNYMIADVRFANGADNAFVDQLFKAGLGDNFLGYSAWNTSANTLGSLICTMKFTTGQNAEFKKLQVIRFLDDWAYQANVRQECPNITEIKTKMKPYESEIKKLLETDFCAEYKFPWNRLFEVEIELD